MNGYKNAPEIQPRIGDVVECGLPGSTAIVISFGEKPADDAPVRIINCAFEGKLCLNDPSQSVVIRAASGVAIPG